MSRHRVAVVVPEEFSPFETAVALEVFAIDRPSLGVDWYDVTVCTARPGEMRPQGGLFSVAIDHGLEAVDAADTVIVPGAERIHAPAPPETLDALRRAYDRGARLVSFCSGAFTLAAAGVLDGRRATTHWMYAEDLARAYPTISVDPGVLFVDEGQVLTSAGTAAGIDLSLHLVRRDHGARVARQVARSMVVPPLRDGGQAQFIASPLPTASRPHDDVRRAMEHATRHLDAPLGLGELARIAHMSERSFSRRFREATGTTPNRWVLGQRLARARELLEETDETVERIARLTGFGSAVTLRQRFAAELRTSPSAYRRAFRGEVGRGFAQSA